MSRRLSFIRKAARFSVHAWLRARQEWAIDGVYGLRRLVARRVQALWLRRLIDPFAPAESLAAAGRVDDAIEFCRARLGPLATVSSSSLRSRKAAWTLLADLLVVNGEAEEAEHIYTRILKVSENDLTARWGLANLRRRKGSAQSQIPLKVHFFTLVLNGMPLIKGHIDEMLKLPFEWHWHIVEGIAALNHDTAWSRAFGGRADETLHRNGLSNDGTSEYLDHLVESYPDRISLYRAPRGRAWDGKVEMVRAPLANINEECLLWQIDVDESWTADQIARMRQKFIEDPDRTAAFFLCHYFVKNLVITTANTYGNHLDYEWLRVWRFRPGDHWLSHEPPRLCRRLDDSGIWTDLASINPFAHGETLRDNLVFRHLAYVLPQQLRFKEIYYGYKSAFQQWQDLPVAGPVHLRDHLPWITDGAIADECHKYDIAPPVVPGNNLGIPPVGPAKPSRLYRSGKTDIDLVACNNILIVKLDNIGDAVLLSPFLRELRSNAPHARITLMVQRKVHNVVAACPYIDRIVPVELQSGSEAFRCSDDEFLVEYDRHDYDLTIVPRWDIDQSQAGLIARRSGAKRVVGFSEGVIQRKARENRGLDEYFTDVLPKVDPDHEVVQNLALLRFMNGTIRGDKLEAWITPEDRARAAFLMQSWKGEDGMVAVCPGASHIGKVLPHSNLIRILERLPSSLRFVLLGGPEDRERSRPLIEHFGKRMLPLCGETSLREAIAILERCRAALTMDSALAHFAAAIEKPVAVFSMHPRDGGNDTLDQSPARFGPWCPPERRLIMQPDRAWPGCESGCRWRSVRPHCIGNIDYAAAARAIEEFLAQQEDTAFSVSAR